MNIPLTDLKAQYQSLKAEIDAAMNSVLDSGEFILSHQVEAFEREMAAYLGVRHCVGVASGTEALQLALLACGVAPGDEVITTPFTFIATTEAITQCGAVPVFVDIDPRTYNLNASMAEGVVTEKTKALLPVHLYGHPCDMTPILELARTRRLKIIEDCAQAFGSEYRGTKVGALGDAGCFSFFPSKILGAYGDAGLVSTGDAEIAERLLMLRNHGSKQRYYHLIPGFNSRLDSFQAAILRVKLRHVDDWVRLRRQKASLYEQELSNSPAMDPPYAEGYARHAFNYYTIRLREPRADRSKLRDYLSSNGVATAIYYPLSLHLQPVYQGLGYKAGDFPISELAQNQVLSLPIYPELVEAEIGHISNLVRQFLALDGVR